MGFYRDVEAVLEELRRRGVKIVAASRTCAPGECKDTQIAL